MTNNGTFMALLTGAAIGASFGILYAPAEGTKTREKIKQKAMRTKHEWESRILHAGAELTKTADRKEIEFEHKLENAIADMDAKGNEIISSLERKLGELQKKNAQFKK